MMVCAKTELAQANHGPGTSVSHWSVSSDAVMLTCEISHVPNVDTLVHEAKLAAVQYSHDAFLNFGIVVAGHSTDQAAHRPGMRQSDMGTSNA